MSPWVATHADLQLSGMSPAACVPDARDLVGVDLVTGVFELDGHGFSGGEPVRFSARTGNALPGGVLASTYYTVDATSSPDFFTLLPLLIPSSAPVGIVRVIENVIPKIDRIMAQWTSILIARAKAYKPPWSVPPTWAPMMVAKLAAPTVANVLRIPSDRYPVKMIEDGFAWAEERCVWLERGEPMDDGVGPVDASPGLADIGAIAGNDSGGAPSGATQWRTRML